MAGFETSLEIDRPVVEVFAFMVDPANMSQWQPGVEHAYALTPGPTQRGSLLAEVRSFLGKTIETTVEVVGFEENERFDIKVVEGPVPFEVNTRFEDLGDQTRVVATGRGEPGGVFRLAGPLVNRTAQIQLRMGIEKLKEVLEAEGE